MSKKQRQPACLPETTSGPPQDLDAASITALLALAVTRQSILRFVPEIVTMRAQIAVAAELEAARPKGQPIDPRIATILHQWHEKLTLLQERWALADAALGVGPLPEPTEADLEAVRATVRAQIATQDMLLTATIQTPLMVN